MNEARRDRPLPELTDLATASVSVVIPHFGSAEPARALVERLKKQDWDRSMQIIVVDDASPEQFPDVDGVEVLRRKRNGGFGSAVNSGAALAEHPWLMILNSDLEIADDFVTSLVTASTPWSPAVTGPRIIDLEGKSAWSGRRFPTVAQQTAEWLIPLARFRDRPWMLSAVGYDTRCTKGRELPVDWLVGAALLLPTSAFLAIGGFDERFFMNSEEVDLQHRLHQQGFNSVFIGSVEAVHEGGGSTTDVAKRRRWLVTSRLQYADKWGRRRRLQLALGSATMVNAVWNSGRRLLGRPVSPVEAVREELALLRLPCTTEGRTSH